MNAPGGQQPAGRVLPARQRLQPVHASVGQPQDGLVVHPQLVAVQRAPQVGLELGAVEAALAQLGPVQRGHGTAAALRVVHRHVGVAEQVVGGGPGVRHRQADADAHGERVAVDHALGTEPVEDPLGQGAQRVGVVEPLHEDGELVATETGHDVGRTHAGPQLVGHLAHEQVADVVPEPVVDGLERVQVEVQHGRRAADHATLGDGAAHLVGEHAAVDQAGERVRAGEPLELVDQPRAGEGLRGVGGERLQRLLVALARVLAVGLQGADQPAGAALAGVEQGADLAAHRAVGADRHVVGLQQGRRAGHRHLDDPGRVVEVAALAGGVEQHLQAALVAARAAGGAGGDDDREHRHQHQHQQPPRLGGGQQRGQVAEAGDAEQHADGDQHLVGRDHLADRLAGLQRGPDPRQDEVDADVHGAADDDRERRASAGGRAAVEQDVDARHRTAAHHDERGVEQPDRPALAHRQRGDRAGHHPQHHRVERVEVDQQEDEHGRVEADLDALAVAGDDEVEPGQHGHDRRGEQGDPAQPGLPGDGGHHGDDEDADPAQDHHPGVERARGPRQALTVGHADLLLARIVGTGGVRV